MALAQHRMAPERFVAEQLTYLVGGLKNWPLEYCALSPKDLIGLAQNRPVGRLLRRHEESLRAFGGSRYRELEPYEVNSLGLGTIHIDSVDHSLVEYTLHGDPDGGDMGNERGDYDALHAWLSTGAFPMLDRLTIRAFFGDHGLLQRLASMDLPNLRTLTLSAVAFDPEDFEVFAQSPTLSTLTSIELEECVDREDSFEVHKVNAFREALIESLIRSETLGNLQTLKLETMYCTKNVDSLAPAIARLHQRLPDLSVSY